jgi:predicted RNase H-like HicB family nuclease
MVTKTKIENKQLRFTIPIIVKPDSVGFHSYSPALKGLHMDGDTQKEALDNARKAAKDYLEILIEVGMSIPLSILPADKTSQYSEADHTEGYFIEEIKINFR